MKLVRGQLAEEKVDDGDDDLAGGGGGIDDIDDSYVRNVTWQTADKII